MRGFKAFNNDLTCRGMQYEIGNTYEFDGKPIPCKQGFHFCKTITDCYRYYSLNDNTRICVIEATGDIETDDGIKFCTNKITIISEITEDWERKGNLNSSNTGYCNTGDRNTGDRNTGYCNTGYRNTGYRNTGNRNAGVFNTETPTIAFFDKPSEWTYDQWRYSEARGILERIRKTVVEWVNEENMSDKEKEEHPEYQTIGGYLKESDESENAQIWWDGLLDYEKEVIYSLPNFNKDKFSEIVGIVIG